MRTVARLLRSKCVDFWVPVYTGLLIETRMSALGQKRTSSATPYYVRFRGNSGHWMSAFRGRRNFPPPMSAIGGKADVRELPSLCLLIAKSGHSRLSY